MGFATGLGAALADALYAAVAAFGLTAIIRFLQVHARGFQLIAIALLVLLALQIIYHAFRSAPAADGATPNRLVGAIVTTFLLTLVNPLTVLSFAAAFTIIALHVGPLSALLASAFTVGAFLGSATWWLGLSAAVAAMRKHFSPNVLRWVSVGSALGLLAFAIGWRSLH